MITLFVTAIISHAHILNAALYCIKPEITRNAKAIDHKKHDIDSF
jgi:hypothetical protein